MSTTGNHNTAQQQGATSNPFKGISSMYNAHLQHKDRVASLKQREEHFTRSEKLKAAGMLQKESHFNRRLEENQNQFNATQEIKNKKLDLDASKHNLDINKFNHKVEKDQNDFNQKEQHHKDKIAVAVANTKIKGANHDTFNKDVEGKNITRNLHNKLLTKNYNDNVEDKRKRIQYEEAAIPKTERKGTFDVNIGKSVKPEWKTKKLKEYKLPTGTTTRKTKTKKAGPVVPSGKNIKGSHGNRKKGL